MGQLKGFKHTEESKRKISISKGRLYPPIFDICHCKSHCNEIVWGGKQYKSGHNSYGQDFSHEHRNNISIALKNSLKFKMAMELNKGDNNPSKRPEVREKISKVKIGKNHHFYGKHHTNEHKRKIREAQLGRVVSEETKIKLSESRKGSHPSEETKRKQSEAHQGEKNWNFNNWSSRKPYCIKWSSQLREEVRKKYNYKCFICNKDQEDNLTKKYRTRKLSIHHIDYDKEQGCNGKDFALIPLCSSCHSKTNNKLKRKYWEEHLTELLYEKCRLNRHFMGDI